MTGLALRGHTPWGSSPGPDLPAALPGQEWKADGLCRQTDTDIFFPPKGGSPREAKRVCTRCPVRGECLQWALTHNEPHGIWGGLSEIARRRLAAGLHADRKATDNA